MTTRIMQSFSQLLQACELRWVLTREVNSWLLLLCTAVIIVLSASIARKANPIPLPLALDSRTGGKPITNDSFRIAHFSKSRQRGPSRLGPCFLQPDLLLSPSHYFLRIRSHGEYYLKVPLRVLVESTSRVSPTHYPPTLEP